MGYCDIVTAASVQGWAYDPTTPDEPLVMQVLIDGNHVCSVKCDLVRHDVMAAGYSSRKVGFYISIPSELQNGDDHTLEFRGLDETPILLHDRIGPCRQWICRRRRAVRGR